MRSREPVRGVVAESPHSQGCAREMDCFGLASMRATKERWIRNFGGELILGRANDKTDRVFARVGVMRRTTKVVDVVWMDAITGTFYDLETRRSEGGGRLSFVRARKQVDCKQRLLEMKPADMTGGRWDDKEVDGWMAKKNWNMNGY